MSASDSRPDMTVRPYKATRRVRAAIGGIILAAGEIDHLISLALFKTVGLDQAMGFTLFDRANVSTKFEKLRYLVQVDLCKNGPSEDEFLELQSDFIEFNIVRNMVAHGVIVGKADNEIIFRLTAEYNSVNGYPIDKAVGATERNLMLSAKNGWIIADVIRFLFDVRTSQETGSYILLRGELPSQKRKSKRHPSKRRTPPEPSRA